MSILVATDFSDPSRAALRAASRLAGDRGLPLKVAHFVEEADTPPWTSQYEMPDDVEAEFREEAERQLGAFVDESLPDDRRPSTMDLEIHLGSPTDGLPERTQADGVELVALGATGRNPVTEFLVGSTAEEIVRSVDCPVLVVPASVEDDSYDRIVAPVDFSEGSRRSVELAASVAREEGAALHIIHAYIPPTSDVSTLSPMVPPERIDQVEEERERRFDAFVDEFELDDLPVQTELAVGTPHAAVVDTVEQQEADLVVMGTHGRRGFERFFLGSTAAKILRRMPCSIMTVRNRTSNG